MFAPTTVSQKFVVILSYVVTLNLYKVPVASLAEGGVTEW